MNRYQVFTVSDDELPDWYQAGWSYIEPAEVPGYSIIAWEQLRLPVAPLEFRRVPEISEERDDLSPVV